MKSGHNHASALLLRLAVGICILSATVALPAGTAAEKKDSSQGKQDDGELKIAVVDLQKVIRNSQRWKDFREQHGLEMGRMEKSLKELKNHAQSLKQEYQNLAPGSEEAKKKKSAIEETLKKFRKKKAEYQRTLQSQLGNFLSKTLGRVRNAVQTYAEKHNVDLVLKKGRLKPQESGLKSANQSIMGVGVLYSRDRMDATEEVTSILDSNYNGQIEVK